MSAPKAAHSPKFLSEILHYDEVSGKLFWKPRPREMFKNDRLFKSWNAQFCGKEALTCINEYGYKRGCILGKSYLAHRVAFAVYYKAWPNEEVDHINGKRSDNRIKNIRAASRFLNNKNSKKRDTNSSGHNGVTWHKKSKKWQARITVNGKATSLGYFHDLEDAAIARKNAEKGKGFTLRHGA